MGKGSTKGSDSGRGGGGGYNQMIQYRQRLLDNLPSPSGSEALLQGLRSARDCVRIFL